MNKRIKNTLANMTIIVPDKTYLKIRYYLAFHKKLDLKNPQTYTEKLQWMKLYDHNDKYTEFVDKYEVKNIVSNIDNLYVIPTLAVWNNADEIDIKGLPDKFVLKCTHDSGSIKIFKSKEDFNERLVKKHFRTALKKRQYLGGREWAYKNVKPRIIAEPFLEDEFKQGLRDYKFFCFNGQVKMLFVATDRCKKETDVKFDFFDDEFKHLAIKNGHENADNVPNMPEKFDEMKRIAEQISRGLRHVRVDLYEVDGKVYFGEMTFYHHSGFVPFYPDFWDKALGDWIPIY